MTYPWDKKQFYINGTWGARRETSADIADRLKRYLDRLGRTDCTLVKWHVGKRGQIEYSGLQTELEARIARDVAFDEDGIIDEVWGYKTICHSNDRRQKFCILGSAGGYYPVPFLNRIIFQTNSDHEADPTIVTYRLMKAVMLATIDCWEPDFCITRSNQLDPDYEHEGQYTKAWMTYVPPAHVEDVDLLGVPFAERTADGGYLLSATEEIFRPENPVHLEGAARISRALQPLNAFLPRA